MFGAHQCIRLVQIFKFEVQQSLAWGIPKAIDQGFHLAQVLQTL